VSLLFGLLIPNKLAHSLEKNEASNTDSFLRIARPITIAKYVETPIFDFIWMNFETKCFGVNNEFDNS
jgi:hypothetical protein